MLITSTNIKAAYNGLFVWSITLASATCPRLRDEKCLAMFYSLGTNRMEWFFKVIQVKFWPSGQDLKQKGSTQYRADSKLAPSQWETSLQSNAVSNWLGANLESALQYYDPAYQCINFHLCNGYFDTY